MSAIAALCGTLALAAATAAQSPSWTCVPGEDGRWRCGEGATEPETSPLPALEEAPANNPPGAAPAPDAPGPAAASAVNAGQFALKIASVSTLEELPAFVDSYGLDPALVRHVEINEGGATRQVILWGAFVSAEQARRAVAGLPRVVRSMRPQIVRTDGFTRPAEPMVQRVPAARRVVRRDPAPADAEPAPVEIADAAPEAGPIAESPAAPLSDAAPVAPEPPPEPDSHLAAAPVTSPEPTPAERPEPPPVPEPVAASPSPEPSAESPGAPLSDAAPPEPASTPEPEPRLADAAPAAPVTRPDPAPEPTPPLSAPRRPPPPPAEAPAMTSPTGRRTSTAAVSEPPGRGAAAFSELDAGAYTVQLTSLRDAASIERYLSRHRLDSARIYRFRVDEGAGPRWLLLWGAYPTVSEAEAGRDTLPASVRSPWVRRVGPLQQRLGLQSRR